MKKSFLIAALFAMNCMTMTHAEDSHGFVILSPSKIVKLLGPYPASGSAEELKDLDTLLMWQEKRTKEQCDDAAVQADDTSVRAMFSDNDGPISPEEAEMLESKLIKYKLSVGANIFLAKATFGRPRPYDAHQEVRPCIRNAGGDSYPSGHTAYAQFYGKLLADMFPERALLIQKYADYSSLLRVIGGVHYPSDIIAGKKLAEELYRMTKKNLRK